MWRLLPDLQAGAQYQGRVLRIKGSRRQGVSAVCFDSFLLTSEPHSHLATFYPSSGSETPPLTTLFRPSTFECVDYPETHFCSAQAFAFKRIGSPGTSFHQTLLPKLPIAYAICLPNTSPWPSRAFWPTGLSYLWLFMPAAVCHRVLVCTWPPLHHDS